MPKSIKLKNNTYWDSKSIDYKHNNLETTLDNILNNVNNSKETVLWSGSKKINTSINSSITLSGMPNLTNYVGKKIKFYFNYGGNSFVKEFQILGAVDYQFFEFVRDYTGSSDAWHLLISISSMGSTSWTIKTNHSYVISNTNIQIVNPEIYSWYIHKVSVIG